MGGNLRRDTHTVHLCWRVNKRADIYVFNLEIQGVFSRLSFHCCLCVIRMKRALVLLCQGITTMLSFHFSQFFIVKENFFFSDVLYKILHRLWAQSEINWGEKQTKYLTISSRLHSVLSCKGEDIWKLWVLVCDKYSPQLLFDNFSSQMTITGVSSII